MPNLRYVLPKTDNFREERPTICWEYMYGWLDGYGMLFDPAVYFITGSIPEWENGLERKIKDEDFIISPCAQASALFPKGNYPGIYVRPEFVSQITETSRLSEKEKLTTPLKNIYYPFGLAYDRYGSGNLDWLIGENSALVQSGKATCLAFEIFAMLGQFRNEFPEERLTLGANLLAELLQESGFAKPLDSALDKNQIRRIDFQAYGLNRLFIQWLLKLKGKNKAGVEKADQEYISAIEVWKQGKEKEVKKTLQRAFVELKTIRQELSHLDIFFLEYPHLGILFADKGFFELEWPEYSRTILLSYFEQIKKYGYKVSLEAGASCWENITNRYPDLGQKLKELWDSGKIELTNGTFSLPYALMSPLTLQYWQFKAGNDTFKNIFGQAPITYQCQENSLTPQMPELLKHFNYKRALHVTQNRGEAPAENMNFINWQSPGGQKIISLTTPNPTLSRKGCNYYFDLPLIHHEYGVKNNLLNYLNFQDLGYVPFRVQMIRAHKYAAVWGEYALAEDVFAKNNQAVLESKSYTADAYKLSANVFYPDQTNVKSLSHYEKIYFLTAWKRQLMLAAYAVNKLAEFHDSINETVTSLCLLEAHDCSVVQGQRRGEFYSANTVEVPPYAREELTKKINEIALSVSANLDKVFDKLTKEATQNLYNAAEVPLAFARVKYPELLAPTKSVRLGGHTYAVGEFPAFSLAEAFDTTQKSQISLPFESAIWKIGIGKNNRIVLAYKGTEISLAPVDKKIGGFNLIQADCKKYGVLNCANFIYQQNCKQLQSVVLTLVFSDNSDYLEIAVKYSPRNDFTVVKKWEDYLAIDIQMAKLERVWRFNPNVKALTREDKVVSPYFLKVQSTNGDSVSLMNEGSFFYNLDRKKGNLNWLFHVANETVSERRMALSFSKHNPFLLSRAWGQGLLPIHNINYKMLNKNNWQDISVEDFITPAEILVSNLKDVYYQFSAKNIAAAKNMAGDDILKNSVISLKPFELGLMQER